MTLVSAALEAPPRNDSAGSAPALWEACTDRLSREIPEQQFNTWIRPLSARLADDGARLTLHVANRFKLDWVRAQYARRIEGLEKDLRPVVKAVGDGRLPVVIALNKADVVREKARLLPVLAAVAEALPAAELFPVSALTGLGVDALLAAVLARLRRLREEQRNQR